MKQNISEQLGIFSAYIKESGLRMTRQREMVVTTFLEAEGHLSTDELFELVREKDGKIGYATVFRTLKALTDCGLARETDLDDGRTRFEHLYKRPRHHHIVCVQCNRTIEFFDPELEQFQERITQQYRFKPVRNRFQIFGVCSDCQQDREPTDERPDADLVFARDALKIAMETERRGVNFYTTAADIVDHEETRQTFLEMLGDEEHHLAGLQEQWDHLLKKTPQVLEAPVFLHFDYDALKAIFPSKEQIKKKLNADLTAEEALRVAMGMEWDAYTFFNHYAEKFTDTRGRDIFLKFAEEELEHYNTIKTALEKFEDEHSG